MIEEMDVWRWEERRGRSGEERIWSSGEVMEERRRRIGLFIGERSGER